MCLFYTGQICLFQIFLFHQPEICWKKHNLQWAREKSQPGQSPSIWGREEPVGIVNCRLRDSGDSFSKSSCFQLVSSQGIAEEIFASRLESPEVKKPPILPFSFFCLTSLLPSTRLRCQSRPFLLSSPRPCPGSVGHDFHNTKEHCLVWLDTQWSRNTNGTLIDYIRKLDKPLPTPPTTTHEDKHDQTSHGSNHHTA